MPTYELLWDEMDTLETIAVAQDEMDYLDFCSDYNNYIDACKAGWEIDQELRKMEIEYNAAKRRNRK